MPHYGELIIENAMATCEGFLGACSMEEIDGISVKRVTIDDILSDKLSKPVGTYVTVDDGGDCFVEVLSRYINQFTKPYTRILCVGVGNADMTTDSLGFETIARLSPTERMHAFCPSVQPKTGFRSVDCVRGLVETGNYDSVLAVDALTTSSFNRIGTSYQLTDSGISVGSALGEGTPFNEETLGVPCIAIGVPTVMSARAFVEEFVGHVNLSPSLLITPKDIDSVIRRSAEKLSTAIRMALSQ